MNNKEEKKKHSLFGIGFIILLVVLFLAVFFPVRYYLIERGKSIVSKSSKPSDDVVDVQPSDSPEPEDSTKKDQKTIILSKETETAEFEHLKFSFTGVKDNGGFYQYTMKVYYDDQEIEQTLFSDTNHYGIWSSDRAASFRVLKVDDLYILDSFNGAQCFGHYVLIINTNKEVLKSSSNVSFSLLEHVIRITESDLGTCCPMGEEACIKEHEKNYYYNVSGSSLVEAQ